jgi:hypothetical protein
MALINFVPFAFRQNNSVPGLFPRRHFIDHRDIQIAVYGLARVLGIGFAVMTSTSALMPLDRNVAL